MVLEEETVEFRCQVQGDPQPNVRWRKDDIDVPRGRYAHLKKGFNSSVKFSADSDKMMSDRSKQLTVPLLHYVSNQFCVRACMHLSVWVCVPLI